MALAAESADAPLDEVELPRPQWPRWLDALALTLLLLIVVPFVLGNGEFTTDEGEVLAQIETLESTGSWVMEDPAAGLDLDGQFFALPGSRPSADGFVPFSKHPAWIHAMRLPYRVGGVAGIVVTQVFFVVALAALTFHAASKLGARNPRAAFWLLGVGSPLVVDAFVVWGHVLGALCATAAAIIALDVMRNRAARFAPILAVGLLIVAGMAIRNEATLFGIALMLVALSRRRFSAAAAWMAFIAVGYVGFARWEAAVVGESTRTFRISNSGDSLVEGRVRGMVESLLGTPGTTITIVVALLSSVGAVMAARGLVRGREKVGLVGLGLMMLAPIVFIVAGGGSPIGGLLIVQPILLFGAVVMSSRGRLDEARRDVALMIGFYVLGVLATQYSDGGGLQWGGRFFHLVVPLALALIVAVVGDIGLRRATVGAVIAASVLWTVAGLFAVNEQREVAAAVVASTLDRVAEVQPGDGGTPVVVGDMTVLGPMSWQRLDEIRPLHAPTADDLAAIGSSLSAAGIDAVAVVGVSRQTAEQLTGFTIVDASYGADSRLPIILASRP